MKKLLKILCISIVTLTFLVSCGSKNEKNVDSASSDNNFDKLNLKCSVATGETGVDYLTAKKFADLVDEASGGQIKIKVFASSQLTGGDMSKTIDSLLSGGVYEICTASGAVLSSVEEKFLAHQLPFIFNSYQEADKYLDGTGGEYYKELASENGMTLVGLFHNGLKQVTNSKKEIKTPDDFKGMKIRIPSGEVAMKTFQKFGADPIAMGWSEVYTALQQGTVDGHDNGYMTIDSASIQEINKYITELNWQYECYTLLINSNEFNKWNPETQKLITEKAKEASSWGRELLEEKEIEIKDKFLKEGVIITELTDDQKKAFYDDTQDIRDYFVQKYGKEVCSKWGVN